MLVLATWDHYPECAEMMSKFWSVAYPDFAYDEYKASELIASFLNGDKSERIAVLALVDGRPVGMIAGMCHEIICSNDRLAHEMMWWINPEHRRSTVSLELQTAFEFWAKKVGAQFVQMSSVESEYSQRLDKVYKRKGFKLIERGYLKRLM